MQIFYDDKFNVIARYADHIDVAADAHGPDVNYIKSGQIRSREIFEEIAGEKVSVGLKIDPPSKEQIHDDALRRIKNECDRRLMEVYGARDKEHLAIKVSNASREAISLLHKKSEGKLTKAQQAREAYLLQANAVFDEIRSASDRLEKKPPADITADKHWPTLP